MTPRQKELARHALGLPNEKRVSYRNYFCTAEGHADYINWGRMVLRRWATRRKKSKYFPVPMFYLTETGARLALEPNERLDPEDFPGADR